MKSLPVCRNQALDASRLTYESSFGYVFDPPTPDAEHGWQSVVDWITPVVAGREERLSTIDREPDVRLLDPADET